MVCIQVKLAKFEQIIEDVGSHCLHHNEIADTLTQIASELSQIDTEAVDGSEDASTVLEVNFKVRWSEVSGKNTVNLYTTANNNLGLDLYKKLLNLMGQNIVVHN